MLSHSENVDTEKQPQLPHPALRSCQFTAQACPPEYRAGADISADAWFRDADSHFITLRFTSFDAVARHLEDESVTAHLNHLLAYHRVTFDHSVRVGLLAADIGSSMGLSLERLDVLIASALLHDIGKTAVPIEILDKSSQLNSAELALIREHPRTAFNMLSEHQYPDVRRVVVAHHEFTSRPYPRNHRTSDNHLPDQIDRRASNTRLLELAEIVAISDIVDATTRRRCYSEPTCTTELEVWLRDHFTGPNKDSLIEQVMLRAR